MASCDPPRRFPASPLAACLRTAVVGAVLAVVAGAAQAFGLDDVAARAKALAEQPYKAPVIKLPQELRDLDYDAYRDIRFRPEKALWRGDKLPFELISSTRGAASPSRCGST